MGMGAGWERVSVTQVDLPNIAAHLEVFFEDVPIHPHLLPGRHTDVDINTGRGFCKHMYASV
jgi:hypothetical protein